MKNKIAALLCIALAVCLTASVAVVQPVEQNEAKKGGVIGMLVGGIVAVIIAGALLPVAIDNTDNLSSDLDAGANTTHDTEATLVDLWPILLTIGVMLAIIGIAL